MEEGTSVYLILLHLRNILFIQYNHIAMPWHESRDPATGRTYYFNDKGETTWDAPPPEFDDTWQELVDPSSGNTYYFNELSGETTWDDPRGGQQQQQHEAPSRGGLTRTHVGSARSLGSDNPRELSDRSEYYYLDDANNRQGPFEAALMLNWYHGGFFKDSMQVMKAGDARYVTMRDMFGGSRNNAPMTAAAKKKNETAAEVFSGVKMLGKAAKKKKEKKEKRKKKGKKGKEIDDGLTEEALLAFSRKLQSMGAENIRLQSELEKTKASKTKLEQENQRLRQEVESLTAQLSRSRTQQHSSRSVSPASRSPAVPPASRQPPIPPASRAPPAQPSRSYAPPAQPSRSYAPPAQPSRTRVPPAQPSRSYASPARSPAPAPQPSSGGSTGAAGYEKYTKMQKLGMPEGAIRQAMQRDGVDPGSFFGGESSSSRAPAPVPARRTPPPRSAPSRGTAPAPRRPNPFGGGGSGGGGRGGLLAAIQQGKKLKKAAPPAPRGGGSRGGGGGGGGGGAGGLMAQIMAKRNAMRG